MNTTGTKRAGAARLHRRLTKREARTAVLVISAIAVPTVAAAHDDPEPGTEARGTAASAATDIAIISNDTGWSLDATRRHLGDQHAFGELQDAIEARFSDTFSGAEFAAAPGEPSFLRFTGTVPAGARTLAAESGLNVSLTGGRKYSATQLADRAVAVVNHFGNAGYQLVGAAVLPSGAIEAAVTGTPKPGSDLPVSLRDGVRVTFADHPVAADLHTYGGAYIHGASSQCTSGFSVVDQSSGVEGVATAAHCSGMNHYHEPQGGPAYDMFWQDQHLGLNGDMEWHTTPSHVVEPEYYASPTDLRQVNSVETSAAVNNTYCVYSRMQGTRTCDQVWPTYVVQLSSSGLASNLVGMDDTNAVGGDSGGPWSYSTEAAGIVKGSIWVPFATHDTWTKAWLFDNSLGVEVQT